LIDEAQSMREGVLEELRLMASHELDSVHLLTVVLAGDDRLLEQLRAEALLPLSSRIRLRLLLSQRTSEDLRAILDHALEESGAAPWVTGEVKEALVAHAGGNLRALMQLGAELLEVALAREAKSLDEGLFFEVFADLSLARPQKRERRAGR
jgi:DNA transposition AAA+ family ATPase